MKLGSVNPMVLKTAAALMAVAAGAAAAWAAETVAYTYDARGRLTKVERSGTINIGIEAAYDYDDADNIESRTVTGAP